MTYGKPWLTDTSHSKHSPTPRDATYSNGSLAGPKAVGELAEELPVSRPAVSQHLKALKDAGLVTEQRDGTRRVYQIDPAGLGQMRAWLDRFWDTALDAFQAEVIRTAKHERRSKKK